MAPRAPDQTRQRILDAAADIFAAKGYHEAAVDDIVRASATSKGAVYFHFPSKEQLFLALIDAMADRLLRAVDKAIAAADDPAICPVCKSDAERQISRFLYDRGDQLDVLPSVPNFATGSRAHARGCACCVPFRR